MPPLSFRVRPHGSFEVGFDLLGPGGAPVGAFDRSVWRESGQVRVGDQFWEFRRERGRRFVLAGPSGALAVADRVSPWSGSWRLSTGGWRYELVKPSWLSRRFELRVGEVPVGRLGPKGVFDNKADVELPAELPPPVAIFVVAVAMTLWRRDNHTLAAAVAVTAAASTVTS